MAFPAAHADRSSIAQPGERALSRLSACTRVRLEGENPSSAPALSIICAMRITAKAPVGYLVGHIAASCGCAVCLDERQPFPLPEAMHSGDEGFAELGLAGLLIGHRWQHLVKGPSSSCQFRHKC